MEQILPPEIMKMMGKLIDPATKLEDMKVNEYNGFRFMSIFHGETVKYAMEEWDIPERAVFVVSFPKTGTNWSIEIVGQILNMKDKRTMQLLKSNHLLYFLEAGKKEKFQIIDQIPLERMLLGTHVCEELFNYQKVKQKKGKVIYVIRNPKDQMVSFYHFTRKFLTSDEMREVFGEDWNQFVTNCLAGIHPQTMREGEGYPEHISGWLQHKDDEDFLIIVYENMKKDLPKEVARIAKFLEIQLTDEEVTSIADACTFTNMKQRIDSEKERMMQKHLNIMRKGEIGGWKEQFTVAQSEQVDKQIEEKMGNTGIKFIYE